MSPTSRAQHLEALDWANEVRLARAQLKREIRDGETEITGVILDPPWEARTMGVAELLRAQRRWGRERAMKLLMRARVSENRTLERLTNRQRLFVVQLLTTPKREWPEFYLSGGS